MKTRTFVASYGKIQKKVVKMKKSIMVAIVAVVSATSWAQFQGPPEGGAGGEFKNKGGMPPSVGMAPPMEQRGGGLRDDFFPPKLIMQNQQSIGLADEQKTAIREVMKKSVSEFTDLQWQESSEQEAMSSMLKGDKIDETKTLEQLDKLLAIENQIKKLHMGTMIKVLNTLTPEQKTKLKSLKNSMGMRPGENQGHRQGSMEGRGGKSSMPPPNPSLEK